MSTPQASLLKKLCSKPETLVQAQALLNTAKLTTGRGTGYDLGQGVSGLPAICAYLASQSLKNDDVRKNVAQSASCLAPKIFEATLSTVRLALSSSWKEGSMRSSNSRRDEAVTYDTLIARFGWANADFLVSCMKDTEQALVDSHELHRHLAPPNRIVTIAVFCWVRGVLKLKKAPPELVKKDYDISDTDFMQVQEIIDSTCDLLRKDILERKRGLTSRKNKETPLKQITLVDNNPTTLPALGASTPQSPTRAQPILPARSPTKSALKVPSVEATPTKTPTGKRKVAFPAESEDEGLGGFDDPTPTRKKRKISDPNLLPRLPALDLTPRASSSSSMSVLADIPEDDEVVLHGDPPPAGTGDVLPEQLVQASLTSAPSTPRRPRKVMRSQFPTTPSDSNLGTPSNRLQRSRSQSRANETGDDPSVPHRHRPVLLSHKQWFATDPRLGTERKLAEVAKQRLVEKYGHPFEYLRLAAAEAGFA